MTENIIKTENKNNIKGILKNNVVTIIFIVITLIGICLSELPFHYIVGELINRISRNTFLVLSLIIPITAGIGLNFGIVVGAMAGQFALIIAIYWGWIGLGGLILAIILATPIAILLGYFTGLLFNNTKGQEMIAGLIVSFFANGIYQFILLFLVGTLIPMKVCPMLKPDRIGLRNTIALNQDLNSEGLKYAFDGIFRMNLFHFLIIGAAIVILYSIFKMFYKGKYKSITPKRSTGTYIAYMIIAAIFIVLSMFILSAKSLVNSGHNTSFYKSMLMLSNLKIPLITWFIIAALAIFNILIMKTKLGQDFKTIGLSQKIATVSGINVNRTRMIAVIMSTVFAAWGQIIFLQNIGTMNTYGSHMQVGLFAVAAILIGGASVQKASIGQAILGVMLFHSVFIVSPTAGKALFGDPQLGEFFRAFVVYGVIGVSLALHAWKNRTKNI